MTFSPAGWAARWGWVGVVREGGVARCVGHARECTTLEPARGAQRHGYVLRRNGLGAEVTAEHEGAVRGGPDDAPAGWIRQAGERDARAGEGVPCG